MHVPLMQNILRISPVSLAEWSAILATAVPMVIGMEVFKGYTGVFSAEV